MNFRPLVGLWADLLDLFRVATLPATQGLVNEGSERHTLLMILAILASPFSAADGDAT